MHKDCWKVGLAIVIGTLIVSMSCAAKALDSVPQKTDWALSLSIATTLEYAAQLADLAHQGDSRSPSAVQLRKELRKATGLDLFSAAALGRAGVAVDQSIVFHGVFASAFRDDWALTVSVPSARPKAAHAAIVRAWKAARFVEKKSIGVGGARVSVLLPEHGKELVGVTRRGRFVHVIICRGGEAILKPEARRVLRRGPRLQPTGQATSLLDGGPAVVAYLNMDAAFAGAVSGIRTRLRAARKSGAERRVTLYREQLSLARLARGLFTGLGPVWGAVGIQAGRLQAQLHAPVTGRAAEHLDAVFPSGRNPGFDLAALSKDSAFVVAGQVDVRELIRRSFSADPKLRARWKALRRAGKAGFGVDVDTELLAALRDHVAFVIHSIRPPTKAELKAAGNEPPKKPLITRLQQAVLLRADGQRLRPLVARLAKSAAFWGYEARTRRIGEMDWYSIGAVDAGILLHVGVADDTLVLGSGPGIPKLAVGWLASKQGVSPPLARLVFNPAALLKAFDAIRSAVEALNLRSFQRKAARWLPLLKWLDRVDLTVTRTPERLDVRALVSHRP